MAFSAIGHWFKYFANSILKRILKGIFLLALILVALNVAANSQKIVDVGGEGNSDKVFRAKVITTFKAFPMYVLEYLNIVEKPMIKSEIPKKSLLIYEDLERRIFDYQVPRSEKNEKWFIKKAEETAAEFDMNFDQVIEIYVKVELAKYTND